MPALPFVTKLVIGLFGGAGVIWLMFRVFNGYVASTIESGNLRAYERSEQAANRTEQAMSDAISAARDKCTITKDDPNDL